MSLEKVINLHFKKLIFEISLDKGKLINNKDSTYFKMHFKRFLDSLTLSPTTKWAKWWCRNRKKVERERSEETQLRNYHYNLLFGMPLQSSTLTPLQYNWFFWELQDTFWFTADHLGNLWSECPMEWCHFLITSWKCVGCATEV